MHYKTVRRSERVFDVQRCETIHTFRVCDTELVLLSGTAALQRPRSQDDVTTAPFGSHRELLAMFTVSYHGTPWYKAIRTKLDCFEHIEMWQFTRNWLNFCHGSKDYLFFRSMIPTWDTTEDDGVGCPMEIHSEVSEVASTP